MVRNAKNQVRLAPADWGGLCTLALAIVTLLGATIYKLHEVGVSNRLQLTRLDSDLTHVKQNLLVLQTDVRDIAKGIR